MLFYRLIVLSWVAGSSSLGGRLLQTQRLVSPLQVGDKRENVYMKTKTPQKLTSQLQQPPINVIGNAKSLMTQVIASSMRHRGDHPRKFIDFLDNGAQWHHYISKPRGHKSELRINEGNYHVNLKYGNHDIQEQDDRRNRNPDMYAGETISGENSLSKFTAPPVYDEEAAQYQRKTRLDLNFEADTPEAAATEKQNTEQFVNRLHSLMTPLGTPYDFHRGKGHRDSYKLPQNKQDEGIYEQDDEDLGNIDSDFERNISPIEAKPDRKEFSDEERVQKIDKESEAKGDRTMDIIRKYGLSNYNGNGRAAHYHHGYADRDDNDREDKADRKERVEDNNSYKVSKDDKDYQESYGTREASHWRKEGNSKNSDEEGNNNSSERDYEGSKKDAQGDDDDY